MQLTILPFIFISLRLAAAAPVPQGADLPDLRDTPAGEAFAEGMYNAFDTFDSTTNGLYCDTYNSVDIATDGAVTDAVNAANDASMGHLPVPADKPIDPYGGMPGVPHCGMPPPHDGGNPNGLSDDLSARDTTSAVTGALNTAEGAAVPVVDGALSTMDGAAIPAVGGPPNNVPVDAVTSTAPVDTTDDRHGEESYGEGSYGECPYGDLSCGQPPYIECPYGDPSCGQPPYIECPYGDPSCGQPPYIECPYGDPSCGQPPYIECPYGDPSCGQPPYVECPYGDYCGEYPYGEGPNGGNPWGGWRRRDIADEATGAVEGAVSAAEGVLSPIAGGEPTSLGGVAVPDMDDVNSGALPSEGDVSGVVGNVVNVLDGINEGSVLNTGAPGTADGVTNGAVSEANGLTGIMNAAAAKRGVTVMTRAVMDRDDTTTTRAVY